MDIVLASTPASRGNRLWGLRIRLPDNEELASLFFKSAEPTGGKGYEVSVQKSDGSPVACQSQAAQTEASSPTSDRALLHMCASARASDAELYALGDALRVRISLPGSYRQLWIREIEIKEMSLSPRYGELPPRPPYPPPLPALQNPDTAPQGHECAFSKHYFFRSISTSDSLVSREPCQLTQQQCCDIAHDNAERMDIDAFEIDDAGCCLLISTESSILTHYTGRWGYLSDRAGTGVLL
ncbi:MAG: hypothetical protein CL902_01195 [Dehalococcoidia bacterium]|nr:hypothetical protein [Dehalococcoidia bacterium]